MKKQDRFFFICGLFMLASEIWKQYTLTFVIGHGQYDWWYFPFQLCSLAMYLCLAIPFLPSTRIKNAVYTFLMTFSLMGGIFVFFDTSGMHYPLISLTVRSYLWHIGLIGIGITAGILHFRTLKLEDMKNCTCLFGTGCFIAVFLNFSLIHFGNINMFYISPYYHMEQIVFRDIARITGDGIGIVFYILTVIAGAWLFFGFWTLVKKLPKTPAP